MNNNNNSLQQMGINVKPALNNLKTEVANELGMSNYCLLYTSSSLQTALLHALKKYLKLFSYNFPAIIIVAIRAYSVWKFRLVTLRTDRNSW